MDKKKNRDGGFVEMEMGPSEDRRLERSFGEKYNQDTVHISINSPR